MKTYQTIIAAVAAGLALSASTSQASIDYSFANLAGTAIQFNSGSTFQLNPKAPGDEFSGLINGTAYQGYITGSPWTIGAVSSTVTPFGTYQYANITTPGTLTIISGANILTGNLTWGTISTIQTGNNINLAGSINVTGISTTDSALLALLGGDTTGVFTLSATDNAGYDLTQLTSGKEKSGVTFAGQFTTPVSVPEASTVMAGALMLLPFGIGAIRSIRKDRTA